MPSSSSPSRPRFALWALALLAALSSPLRAQNENPSGDPQALGLREPTIEEQDRMRIIAPRVDKVLPNTRALKLANDERLLLGLQPLSLPGAPAGEELKFAPASTSAPQTATNDSLPAGSPISDPTAPTVAAEAAIPSATDNSTSPFFPPIRSQGQIGSCATFAAGYYMGGYMRAMARGLNIKNDRNDDKLSPKFLYAFVNGGADSGSWFTDIFDVLVGHGAPTQDVWPYSGVNTPSSYLEWPTTASVYRNAIGNRMASTYTLTDIDTPAGLERLKTNLANGDVVVFATNVNGWQYTTVSDDPATALDNAFVGRPVVNAMKVHASGHAMTIVGYNDNLWIDLNKNGRVDAGEKGALRIANSWGTTWQDGGFAWVSYDALRVVSAVAGVGTDISQYRAGGGIAPPVSSEGTAGPVSGGAANALLKPVWYATTYGIRARATYTPQLLAQFRLGGIAARNILKVSAGRGSATSTAPDTEIVAPALDQSGGAFALPGSGAASGSATFVLDLTDLALAGSYRYYIKVTDASRTTLRYLTNGALQAFSLFQLTDGNGASLVGSTAFTSAVVSDTVAVHSYTLARTAGAPVITSALTKSGSVNALFQYAIEATNSPASYTAGNLPPGIVLSGGVLSGQPTAAGTFNVTLTATNSIGTDSRTLVVTISPAVAAPVVSSATTASGTRGSPFSYQITASNSPTSYSVSGTLPNGVTLNTATGLISGTPAEAGVFNIQVSASNAGGSGTRALAFTVTIPTAPVPVISSATTATVAADNLFNYRITASNLPTAYGAQNLPSGLTLSTATGVITGRVSLARSYQITLTATNASGIGYATLVLEVTGGSSFGPANDGFASRVALSGASVSTTGANVNATAETGEPAHAGSPAATSVWWSWTAPSSGTLTVSTAGSAPAMRSALYTGTSVSALTPASPASGGAGTYAVTAGTVYFIAVDSVANATGSIALALSLSAPAPTRPGNDNFAAAITLTAAGATATATTTAATAETGEPAHGETAARNSVWYKWTAPAAGRAVVSLRGSDFDTMLSVYTGTALTALTAVIRDDDSGGNLTSEATFNATAGTTYSIAADGWSGDSGNLALALTFTAGAAGPGNDNFAAATLLSGSTVTLTGSSVGATRQTGEPTHAGLAATSSVWFRWVAPSTGTVGLSTVGSAFDTLLAVYTGSTLAGLAPVTSNDDNGTDTTSMVYFSATAGTTYSFAIDGYDGDTGSYRINLTLGSSVANNNAFASAATLVAGVSTTAISTTATAEAGEPAHLDGNPATKSLWWRWTATANGFVAVGTAGSNFDTVLSVYTGTALSALTKISENDDASPDDVSSSVFFRAIAGRTYLIAVDGYAGSSGTVLLTLTQSANASTVYETDFERFTTGTGQLVNQDQWTQICAPASGNAQGILPQGFSGQGRAGYLGYGAPDFTGNSGNSVYVYRPLNFDPVAEGAPVVQVRVDISIIASTNGRNDVFRLSLYNRAGNLLGGFYFDTATRRVSTSDGVTITPTTFTFTPNTRYTILGTFNFATRRWTARINATELITDAPFAAGVATVDIGDFDFVWRLVDAQRAAGDNFIYFDNLAITADPVPTTAPVVQLPATAPVGAVSSPLSYAIAATNGPITAYSATGLPTGLTLNAVTGLVTGTPTQAGTFVASFTATNSRGQSAVSTSTFTILSGPPVINSAAQAGAKLGQAFSFQVTATNSPRTFGLRGTATLPSGLTLNPTTGLISGTPGTLGTFRLTVAADNAVGSGTATFELNVENSDVSRLSNLAVRTTLTANQVLTVGFTMSGGAKNLLIRAAGPGLGALGVPGTMADPKLALFNSSTQIAANDNWAGNAAVASAIASVGAFPFPGATSLDAALVASVDGGRTVQVSGPAAGNVIVEVYDAGTGNSPRLTNLSALNRVGTGGDILIAGFTIAGATTKNLLIRAAGPGLAALGVGGTLADPKLEIYNSAQVKIDQNDTWSSTLAATFVSVGAFPLPAGSKDAALIVSLPPGGYTVQVSGADGGTGSAIIEVYELP